VTFVLRDEDAPEPEDYGHPNGSGA
jgi:hypothetical protein